MAPRDRTTEGDIYQTLLSVAVDALDDDYLTEDDDDYQSPEAQPTAPAPLTFESLTFSGAAMGIEGVTNLMKTLSGHIVHKLNLSKNELGDVGVKALVPLFLDHQLETLDLSGNNVGAVGFKAIASCMNEESWIDNLNLSGNKFDDDCIPALLDIVSYGNVDALVMDDQPISEKAVLRLAKRLATSSVTSVSLRGCGVTKVGQRALISALKTGGVMTLLVDEDITEEVAATTLKRNLDRAAWTQRENENAEESDTKRARLA